MGEKRQMVSVRVMHMAISRISRPQDLWRELEIAALPAAVAVTTAARAPAMAEMEMLPAGERESILGIQSL